MRLRVNDIPAPRVEMMPLIDIVFLLLVFFIYAMLSMVVHRGLVVDLPEASQVAVEMDEALNLTISDRGDELLISVDGVPVALSGLTACLAEHDGATEVQIFGDETISYQELFQVMDRVKQAGLAKISLQAKVGGGEK